MPYLTIRDHYLTASRDRWESLRTTEGWAALQHHNLLRTTLTVYPPSGAASRQHSPPPRLIVTLLQGSYFTVRPLTDVHIGGVPEWHMGNIYAMGAAPPGAVELPTPPSLTAPTTYELLVSGDYEVTLIRPCLVCLIHNVAFTDTALRGPASWRH